MLTDQKQYVRYTQILFDAVCFLVLYTILTPVIITACSDCGLLFATGNGGLNNICIYKSTLYVTGALAVTLGSAAVSALATIPATFFASRIYTFILVPLCLCLFNWFLLEKLLNQFPSLSSHMNLILLASTILLLLLLLLNRINIWAVIRKSRSHNFLIKHIALAGINDQSLKMARFITAHPGSGLRFAGFLSTGTENHHAAVSGFRVLGHITDLPSIVLEQVVDIVLTLDQGRPRGQMDFLFKTCATMGLEFGCPSPIAGTTGRAVLTKERLGGNTWVRYRFNKITPLKTFLKRVFDFTASSLLILLCLPFWIVVPLMIKSSSKGPVLFRQERIGKYGRKFTLYKFRSMHQNAENIQETLRHLNEMDGPAFKIKEDPRQTPTGRVLRKHSLDELPQLLNVFKGDISLVGPRPAIGGEVRQYRLSERRRLSVVQGITCIWQVSGRNEIKFDEWMKLDLMYIDTWSNTGDFKILFRTIPAVLIKRGAY